MSLILGSLLASAMSGGGGGGSAPASGGTTSGGGGSSPVDVGAMLGNITQVLDTLKCWGSSWTPARGKQFVNSNVPPMVARFESLGQTADENSEQEINAYIQSFVKKYEWERAYADSPTNPPGKCTGDTIRAMAKACDEALNTALDNFRAVMQGRGFKVRLTRTTYTYTSTNTFQLPITKVKIEKTNIVPDVLGVVGVNSKNGMFNRVLGGGLLLGGIAFGISNMGDNNKKKKKKKK